MKCVLEAGADKNAANQNGATSLFFASQHGHLKVVQSLLEAGADKNAATEKNGSTSLLVASQQGHLEVVKCLLEAGADKNACMTDGAVRQVYSLLRNMAI